MTVQELINTTTRLFGSTDSSYTSINSTLNFMTGYLNDSAYIDKYFANNYANITVKKKLESTIPSIYELNLYAFLITNRNELNKIYDVLHQNYEPLSNYDKLSEITTLKDKEITTNSYSQKEKDSKYGARKNTDAFGEKKNVVDNQISAFDTNVYSNDNKSTNTLNANTDTHSSDAVTDTEIEKARTDTTTITGNQTNGDRKETVSEHTSGNIGVTTSQQMLESELNLRLNWGFYQVLFDKWLEYFTIQIYE